MAVLAESVVYNIHTDQLNTPRLLTAAVGGTAAWAWDPEPFGNTQPTGTFTYNHRFPGQYYDHETGLHHNGNRDYDKAGGRYNQSDPLGLAAGLNTYAYVNSNPLRFIDPFGLAPRSKTWWCTWCGARHGELAGDYCADCDKKSKDPDGGVPQNPTKPEPAEPDTEVAPPVSGTCPSGNNDCQIIPTVVKTAFGIAILYTCILLLAPVGL